MLTTYISKDDSNVIKGIAILMMLFYHLFNRVTDGVADWWVGGEPLTRFLSQAAYPVPYFLMMSGYGLYYQYQKGRLTLKYNSKRAFKLYLHYWMVMLIFVSIGSFLVPRHYPGSVGTVVGNIVGIDCTYNYETWFLLPYVVLSLLAPCIFTLINRLKLRWSLLLAFLISYGAAFVISRYVATNVLTNQTLVFVIVVSGLLFDFVIGAAMAKFAASRKSVLGGGGLSLWAGILLLVGLVLLRCTFRLHWNSFYSFAVVFVVLNMSRVNRIDRLLMALGKKSMVMWMVHTYFSIYLFHDFIYSFKYPIVIWGVLIVISYFTAVIIQKICSFLLDTYGC